MRNVSHKCQLLLVFPWEYFWTNFEGNTFPWTEDFWEIGWAFLTNRLMIQLTSTGKRQTHRNCLHNDLAVCGQNHTHGLWIRRLVFRSLYNSPNVGVCMMGSIYVSRRLLGKDIAFLIFDNHKGPERTKPMVGRGNSRNSWQKWL